MSAPPKLLMVGLRHYFYVRHLLMRPNRACELTPGMPKIWILLTGMLLLWSRNTEK